MEIKQVSVDKLFSLGNYNNERIGLTANLSDGEDASQVVAKLFLQITGIEDVFAMYRRAIDETEEAIRRVEGWKCRVENTKCELGKMKISMEELTAIIAKGGEVADERLQHACRSKSYKDVKEQLEREQQNLEENEKTLTEIKTLREELKARISKGVFNTDGLSVPLIPHESVYYG